MRAKRLVIGLLVLGAILACTLPFSSLEEADCVTSGGVWIPETYDYEEERYVGRYCDRSSQQEAVDPIAPQAGGEQVENPQEEPIVEAAEPYFSLEDCQCGVPLPLNENLSSVSSKRSGMQVEVAEVLTCDWSQDYTSERKTGELRAYLEVFKLTNAEDAQTLFQDFLENILAFPQYCSDDRECTIAVSEVSDQYAFYVEKYTFIRGDGVELPSAHNGFIAAMDSSSSGASFAWRLNISHPELELGGTWVEDTSQIISACVIFDIVK